MQLKRDGALLLPQFAGRCTLFHQGCPVKAPVQVGVLLHGRDLPVPAETVEQLVRLS
jgi:hypothetical protein